MLSTAQYENLDGAQLEGDFRSFVAGQEFPCVGAKSALARDGMTFMRAHDIRSAWDDLAIHHELTAFARDFRAAPGLFRSFVLLFEQPGDLSETEFERCLWARLQSLSDKDCWLGEVSDPRVSANPEDPHFALSFGGEAFFVVGLHPGASRPARRFQTPAIAFNPHHQFEVLRAEERYDRLRDRIIERDIRISGCPNPMLATHGEQSAAPQYSGRSVGGEWKCPFARTGAGKNPPSADERDWSKRLIPGW